jgi:hypothetical protein
VSCGFEDEVGDEFIPEADGNAAVDVDADAGDDEPPSDEVDFFLLLFSKSMSRMHA